VLVRKTKTKNKYIKVKDINVKRVVMR